MDPALHKAATQGDVQRLRQLLTDDPMILSSMTPQDNTALHIAARLGHRKFAEEVLKKTDTLLIMKNTDGDTPFHLAARAGKVDVVDALISHALTWPEDLRTQQWPLMMTNKVKNTPLHEAVANCKCDVALRLLAEDPSLGHTLNEKMESPLHIASREGLDIVVQKIVDHPWVEEQRELEPSVSSSGSALHQAVLGGHIKIMQMLLDKRSDLIKFTDSSGNNALHYTAQKNNARMVSMLLNKDPSLAYVKNNEQQSPLHVAAQYGSTEAIKALLNQCPDIAELVDDKGRNAFHIAIVSRKVNALKCLLRYVHPEDIVNRIDEEGNTPLHLAARLSRIQSALMLLKDKRVNPCIVNKEGHTARSTIEKTEEMSTYEMFLWEELKKQESMKCKKQQLPPVAKSRSARKKASSQEYFELSVETYTLVATLIATVTFAATFTMPGGNQQNGMATLGHKAAFKMFVISNTIAMCSSIVVVFCFIWAWRDPVRFKLNQLTWGHRLTVVACLAMVVSLMTAVYLTVVPESRWVAYVVIAIGGSTPVIVFLILGKEVLFVPM